MPKLTIPGPQEGQMSVEDFGQQHVGKQEAREKQQALEIEPPVGERFQRREQDVPLKLDTVENIEKYRVAVREAMGEYRQERTTEREHFAHNGQEVAKVVPDQDRARRIEREGGLTERRDQTIEGAERQIDTALRAMNPKTGEKLRALVEGHLDQIAELSNVGHLPMRPGLERLENQGVLQKSTGPITLLGRGNDGNYHLDGPDGTRQRANGDFAFAIPLSNPTEIRVGSRDQGGHMALTRGGDVYFAGELHFRDGQLQSWDNGSGHYMPTVEQSRQVSETAISSLETLLPRDKFTRHNG